MKLYCCRPGSRLLSKEETSTNPRVVMFLATLSPKQRAAVASRPKFYRIPWIKPAGEPDHADELLF